MEQLSATVTRLDRDSAEWLRALAETGPRRKAALARLPARIGFDPAREAEWRDLRAALHRAVDEVLTDAPA